MVVMAFPAGSTVTYGLQTLGNSSASDSIELLTVSPVMGDPPPEARGEVKLLGPERVATLGAGAFDVVPGWPPSGTDPIDVTGQRVPAGTSSHVEVVLPVAVPPRGMAVIEGFDVEYRVDGRRYQERSSITLVLCPSEYPQDCAEFEQGL
ncbi:hypothetical protein [Actinotalea sp. C106]|uniref:hypothetical protein n=1 Tax=Actinotalea sp. C106 TaxID=2908644 RepID=UPI002028614B|nr:hypothetical protein [Actinotalea sp. C106]